MIGLKTLLRCSSISLAMLSAGVHADPLSEVTQGLKVPTGTQSALPDSDIAMGLKQALANGTRAAVNQLGQTDGFWGDARFRIPLPGGVEKAESALKMAGMGPKLDELHLAMNRAAEQAVPIAADIFASAVQKLSVEDARSILSGPPDAATQYFKRTTSDELAAQFKPVVAKITAKAGLVQDYDKLMASAGPMTSMLGGKTDINDFVTHKALDGLFLRVGDEEKSIRENPAARTTDLLKKVFANH